MNYHQHFTVKGKIDNNVNLESISNLPVTVKGVVSTSSGDVYLHYLAVDKGWWRTNYYSIYAALEKPSDFDPVKLEPIETTKAEIKSLLKEILESHRDVEIWLDQSKTLIPWFNSVSGKTNIFHRGLPILMKASV